MSVFIVEVDLPELGIYPNSVVVATHGRERYSEDGCIRLWARGPADNTEKKLSDDQYDMYLQSALGRARDYQREEATRYGDSLISRLFFSFLLNSATFSGSWILKDWTGIQVIGRISDGGEISYGVESLTPTQPLSVDISLPPDAEDEHPIFNKTLADQWVEENAPATPATPKNPPSPVDDLPIEESHANKKRMRDD